MKAYSLIKIFILVLASFAMTQCSSKQKKPRAPENDRTTDERGGDDKSGERADGDRSTGNNGGVDRPHPPGTPVNPSNGGGATDGNNPSTRPGTSTNQGNEPPLPDDVNRFWDGLTNQDGTGLLRFR